MNKNTGGSSSMNGPWWGSVWPSMNYMQHERLFSSYSDKTPTKLNSFVYTFIIACEAWRHWLFLWSSRGGGGEGEKEREKRRKNGRRRGGGRRGEKKEWRRETTQLQQGEQTKIDPVFQVEGGWRKHWQRMGLYTEMAFRSAFPVELPAVKIWSSTIIFVT